VPRKLTCNGHFRDVFSKILSRQWPCRFANNYSLSLSNSERKMNLRGESWITGEWLIRNLYKRGRIEVPLAPGTGIGRKSPSSRGTVS
jgi:hypothetical protein